MNFKASFWTRLTSAVAEGKRHHEKVRFSFSQHSVGGRSKLPSPDMPLGNAKKKNKKQNSVAREE